MPFGVDDALILGSAASGLVKGIGGWFGAKSDEEKAQEELSKLKQPFYKIQDEYYQNKNIAAEMAGEGLPESTKNYFTTEAQRGLGTAIGGTQEAGGVGGNDAARLYDVYLKNINQTAAQDASARIGNIQNYFTAAKDLAGQKTMKWTLDEYQPYQRKLKELTERISAAKQNKNNSINTAIGTLGAAGTAWSNNNLIDTMFKKPPLTPFQPINFASQGSTLDAGTQLPG